MRIAVIFASVVLLASGSSSVQGQSVVQFSGPLDSVNSAAVKTVVAPPRPGLVFVVPPRRHSIGPVDTAKPLVSTRPADALVERTQLPATNRTPVGQRQAQSAARVAKLPTAPPKTSPKQELIEPATRFGNFDGQTEYTPFHSRPAYVNPQQAIIDANRIVFNGNSLNGSTFGFDDSRLYNPLEGPQLRLQGAPTVPSRFGACDECDEWDGFCQIRELDLSCECGGLKSKPGHLGLPWLGSGESCDKTAGPFERLHPRGRSTKNSCGCSSCSPKRP